MIEDTEKSAQVLSVEYETSPVGAARVIVKKTERKSARKAPKMIVRIVVEEDGQEFEDSMVLKSSIPLASYKAFMKMQKHFESKKEDSSLEEGELSDEAIDAMMELFPDFMMPLIESSSFEVNEAELEAMDTNIKFALLTILLNTLQNTQHGDVAKKLTLPPEKSASA